MDEKKLLEFISKHYEWTYPYIANEQAEFERLKPAKQGLREFKTLTQNPQLGPRIISPKEGANLRECGWCHMICDQRCNHTLKFTSIDGKRPKRRWEHSCQNCKKTWNPETGLLKDRVKPKSRERVAKEEVAKKKEYWWNNLGADDKSK